MRRNTALVVVAAVVLALVGAAWLVGGLVSAGDGDQYQVRVTRDDRELASLDLAALKATGMNTVVLQGKEQTGPTLLAVLKRAGVDDFSQVEIIGKGVDDSGHLVLKRSDVGPDVVLAVSNRGTVKVAGPDISMEMRVRDVTDLVVQ